MSKTTLDRQVWGRWVTIDNYRTYPTLSALLTGFSGDNILGFVYIDHIAGTTLDIVKLFNRIDDKIEFVDTLLKKDTRIIVRYAQFSDIAYNILNDKFLGDYELIKPSYFEDYDKEVLTNFRENEIFDSYRADGFPDDIQILLIPDNDNMNPELVWVRVEDYSNSSNMGNCRLLVQPHQNFGVHLNDSLTFSLMEVSKKVYPVGIIDNNTEQKSEKKPWWKVF